MIEMRRKKALACLENCSKRNFGVNVSTLYFDVEMLFEGNLFWSLALITIDL
jgi:hypothetical protein